MTASPLATSHSPPATIHVVDDDASFRTAIARLVRAGGYEVRGYPSAVEFLAVPAGISPGGVLVDLHMPGPSGLDLQQALAKAEHPLPVIFLTGHGDIPISVQAMREGAEDFLTKPVKKETLFPAIERALARDARERAQRTRLHELRARFDALTPREREVLAHVITGQLNKQIARVRSISRRPPVPAISTPANAPSRRTGPTSWPNSKSTRWRSWCDWRKRRG